MIQAGLIISAIIGAGMLYNQFAHLSDQVKLDLKAVRLHSVDLTKLTFKVDLQVINVSNIDARVQDVFVKLFHQKAPGVLNPLVEGYSIHQSFEIKAGTTQRINNITLELPFSTVRNMLSNFSLKGATIVAKVTGKLNGQSLSHTKTFQL
ncbi:hypothetical protein [Persicobacter sp. CCB-QB2]|uniref:hypothetical protein n=1 Tax=Persicobacter sp. CCB-QB2 TaxID=1561025 RepID=UPI0012FB3AAF|nr:hypothetical protein [Persicobacter sp. CCB-QB2]